MLTMEQAAIVLGMLERGDKQHDIAAHFGENSGRIIDVKFRKGKYADVAAAPPERLQPPYRAPAKTLIDATMAVVDQLQILDELIRTTPDGSPSVVLELLPETAQHVLENRNPDNRKLRPKKIQAMAADLRDGLFLLTGDTIKFCANGFLGDGQNRLSASLLANVPIRSHFIFGLDPDVFKVLDSGAGRTGPDTFQVAHVPHHEIASRATRWIMILQDAKIDRSTTISNSDLFQHYQTRLNRELLQQQIAVVRLIKSRLIPPGTLAALLYRFAIADAKTAAIFSHDLEKGVRGGRTLLAKIKSAREEPGHRVKETWITAHTILAWNAYRDGKPISNARQLRWTEDEPHPVIK